MRRFMKRIVDTSDALGWPVAARRSEGFPRFERACRLPHMCFSFLALALKVRAT